MLEIISLLNSNHQTFFACGLKVREGTPLGVWTTANAPRGCSAFFFLDVPKLTNSETCMEILLLFECILHFNYSCLLSCFLSEETKRKARCWMCFCTLLKFLHSYFSNVRTGWVRLSITVRAHLFKMELDFPCFMQSILKDVEVVILHLFLNLKLLGGKWMLLLIPNAGKL